MPPTALPLSKTVARRPRRSMSKAAVRPAMPAPMIATGLAKRRHTLGDWTAMFMEIAPYPSKQVDGHDLTGASEFGFAPNSQ